MGFKKEWKWALFGKSPMAADYLKIGTPSPLMLSFSKWMEKGFETLSPGDRTVADFIWKFWAKGPNKELVCGLFRPSQDRLGRPYPLLIIGSGDHAVLNKHWGLIPCALNDTWKYMESLVQTMAPGLCELQQALKKIPVPLKKLDALKAACEPCRHVKIYPNKQLGPSDYMNKLNNIEKLARLDRFSMKIDIREQVDPMIPVLKLMRLLETRSKHAPKVVFWGNRSEDRRLLCLKRALCVDDFYSVWARIWQEKP